jgi:hypothetical protein
MGKYYSEESDIAKEKVTGGCRKLHNEELYNHYSSSNIIMAIS